MSTRIGGKGREGHGKVLASPLTDSASYFTWAQSRCQVFDFYDTALLFVDSTV